MSKNTLAVAIILFSSTAALAANFYDYDQQGSFTAPASPVLIDNLPDGRLIILSVADVYIEDAVGTRTFSFAGTLPDADISEFGAAFIKVSPDGTRIAVGNFGGKSFINFEVGVFSLDDLEGTWFTANHFAGVWVDHNNIALTGGEFGSPAFVSILDTTSPNPSVPINTMIIDGIGGASAGIAIDVDGNLHTANGFDDFNPTTPSTTGTIKAFNIADWMHAWTTETPLDFEKQGTEIATILSAYALDFDAMDNLFIGGGNSGVDENNVALVNATAIQGVLSGGGRIDTQNMADVRRFDPDSRNNNFYFVAHNPVANETYAWDSDTIHVIAPNPDPSPFAASVIDYTPAPGQFVNDPDFNDPNRALGPPTGGGTVTPDITDIVTLGGFGGSITLAFDHTVLDHAANPLGLDAIVFSGAFYLNGDPNRKWAESAHIEISLDTNHNNLADDPWYLIPGSHIPDPEKQFATQTWDNNFADPTNPPAIPTWYPDILDSMFDTTAYQLPADPFHSLVLVNPNGPDATEEAIFGYADQSPTLVLGDLDADNVVDDPELTPEQFYTVPDDPFTVGVRPGSAGGDAFDIAWAVDPDTNEHANLPGFDFIRITTAVNHVDSVFGELSADIDAVADAAPGLMADADADNDIDLFDFEFFQTCVNDTEPVIHPLCRVMDFDNNNRIDRRDFAGFQIAFTGNLDE